MTTPIFPVPMPAALSDLERLQHLREGRLGGLKRLDLSCGLSEFPPEIFALADSLEILNLSGNLLTSLPDDLHRLHKLRVLFCSDNRFTALPEAIGRCAALRMVGFKANRIARVPPAALHEALRWLILTDNQIETLPDSLGQCTAMQKLMLSGNRLQRLPESMANCQGLELLRIAANRFTELPDWLLALPRLAWLACAGNPWSDAGEAAALAARPMPLIDWHDLQIGHKVGEGASGVIHLGTWQPRQTELPGQHDSLGVSLPSTPTSMPTQLPMPVPVAVKLFKGAMTSDGLPHSEMIACIAAGAHPGLIGVKGCIVNHPDGGEGLVMTPVDAVFRNLAGPPSFESCTRDVYPEALRFDLPAALGIALAVAGATAHLHARGILHGDVYAHNILWNGQGEALLGDFGAAAFFAVGTEAEKSTASALQRIEARAFGCLLEELVGRCDASRAQSDAILAMSALQHRCLLPEVGDRPLFTEIHDVLAQLGRTLEAREESMLAIPITSSEPRQVGTT